MYEIEFFEDTNGYSEIVAYIKDLERRSRSSKEGRVNYNKIIAYFDLLQELGKTNKPILLKRGLANTLQELLMSAEYIMSEGNENIILCERGIRTYENYTRNTLDLSAIPVLHELSHLPVVVDPSHATGRSSLVPAMAVAAAAAGTDGIMVEVHNNPACALCDGAQSLTPEQFDALNKQVQKVREVLG